MNNKIIGIVVLVLVIFAGIYLYMNNGGETYQAPTDTTTQTGNTNETVLTPLNNPTSTITGPSTIPVTPRPSPAVGAGEHCGGNMATAPSCNVGFHCAPEPGSHLPFGDVGGTCVAD